MQILVGINGFGRLGRLICRAICAIPGIQLVAINDPFSDPEYMACMYSMDAERDGDDGPQLKSVDGVLLLNGKCVPLCIPTPEFCSPHLSAYPHSAPDHSA